MAFYIYYYIIIILSSNQNDLLFLARGNGEKAERHRERAQLLQGKEMSRKGTLHLVHLRVVLLSFFEISTSLLR